MLGLLNARTPPENANCSPETWPVNVFAPAVTVIVFDSVVDHTWSMYAGEVVRREPAGVEAVAGGDDPQVLQHEPAEPGLPGQRGEHRRPAAVAQPPGGLLPRSRSA